MQRLVDRIWGFNVRLFGWCLANAVDKVLYRTTGWSAWCSTVRQ